MTVLVPFDGSRLSAAALEKAADYAELTDDDLLALTVVPDDDEFARERGWIRPDDSFDVETVGETMAARVDALAPDAGFRLEVVDSDEPTATPTTTVVREIRRVADAVDAGVIFVGTANAGGVTTPLSSVGGPVANDSQYDVYIVRHAE